MLAQEYDVCWNRQNSGVLEAYSDTISFMRSFSTVFSTEVRYSPIICLIDPKYYLDPGELGSNLLMYFVSSFFYSDLFLPTHSRCRGLLLSSFTLNDTHIHTHIHTYIHTYIDKYVYIHIR